LVASQRAGHPATFELLVDARRIDAAALNIARASPANGQLEFLNAQSLARRGFTSDRTIRRLIAGGGAPRLCG
jgi:hypothetical protein